MRFRLIEDHQGVWPVRVMCDALSVSPSGYYAWRSRPDSPRKIANRDLLADIRRVHAQHQERYGAPRVHAELRAEGQTVSRKRVERVMRQHGLRARAPRRYRVCTTDSKHSLPVAANLLDQNFVADPAQSSLVGRYHLHSDQRGLALPGRDPRPVHPQGGWLGHARSHACRTHHRCAHHGNPTAAPGSRPDPSFRPRQPVRRRRLPRHPAGRRYHPIDEPARETAGTMRQWRVSSAL